VVLALAAAPAAPAQTIDVVTSDPREHEEQELARKPYRLSTAYAHRFETDLEEMGAFSTDTVRAELTSQTRFTPSLSWDNLMFYEFNTYDFSDTGRGGWWKDVHFLTYIPSLRWKIDKRITVFGGPVLQVSAEDGADFSDGISGGAIAGIIWTRDSNLSVGGAIAAVSRIEDEFGLAPIPLILWRFGNGWTLRSGVPDFGARRGFGIEMTWGRGRWEVGGGVQFQRRRFRLDEDANTAYRNGVGEESSAPVYGKFSVELAPYATLDLFAGVTLWGELKIEDDDGHHLNDGVDPKQTFDPAPILGARLSFLF
jgi:hypothetical protein